MRTGKEAIVATANYLQHVELKYYKSIKELAIDFKPGLNIIIGGNGSGKTNFVSSLYNVLSNNYREQLDTESKITVEFSGGIKISLNAYIDTELLPFNTPYTLSPNHLFDLSINEKSHNRQSLEASTKELMDYRHLWNPRIVSFTSPHINLSLIEKPISLTLLNNGKKSREGYLKEFNNTFFTKVLFYQLINQFPIDKISNGQLTPRGIKSEIVDYTNNIFSELNYYLNVYSPISEVRINPEFKIIIEDDGERISVSNFYLEFKINNQWLPFNFLSDGTKRLFYVISEFADYNNELHPGERLQGDVSIILLEEPELGVHPHQLHKLMSFIKEQSLEKQIILTTHSPQVLDILGADELDRIIICEYDTAAGTTLRHLNEAETKKARSYMKKTFLSDYWRFSDLEPA